MISLIEQKSTLRHGYFEALTALGYSVAVFYSPESFANSEALFAAELLVLGTTRLLVAESPALRRASEQRPALATIVLLNDSAEVTLLARFCEGSTFSNRAVASAKYRNLINCLAAVRKRLVELESQCQTARSEPLHTIPARGRQYMYVNSRKQI